MPAIPAGTRSQPAAGGREAYVVPRFYFTWRLLAARAALVVAAAPAAPEIAATASPAAGPTPAAPAALPDYGRRLPGLSYVKLVAYWQSSFPLDCKGPVSANSQLVWNCNLAAPGGSAQMTMIIFASAGDSLNRISISLVPSGETGQATVNRWLDYAAGTPIAGAAPDQVRAWLAGRAEIGGTMTVGRVKYTLTNSGFATTFEIVPAPGS